MKILMVSWEYPPVVVGGLGRHVYQLATALAADGHEVVVLSRRPTGTDPATHPTTDEVHEGVRVIAAAQDPHDFDFGRDLMAWTLAMGHSMLRAGLSLHAKGWQPDVVHAHDWLVAHPAIALAEFYDVPMVSTVHATEAGRHAGWVSGRISRQVHATESWFVRDSDALIACSASMADEISELFGPGLAEITVIPNGIDSSRWPFARRRRHAGPPELLFFGRLEYEKGVHEAIAALPRIRRTHPGTTLTVAGDGTQQKWLVEVARKHKVLKAVRLRRRCRPRRTAAAAAPRRRRGAAQPLRTVRHRRPGGRRGRHPPGHLQRRRAGRGGDRRPDGCLVPAARRRRAGRRRPHGSRRSGRRPAARGRPRGSGSRRTSTGTPWPSSTAQVYLAAKRREREPLPRRPIIEQPLPGRSD